MKLRLNENLEPKCQRRKFKCKVMLPSKIMSIIKGSKDAWRIESISNSISLFPF